MKAYIWILELGGVAGLFLLGRFLWHRYQARGHRAAHAVRETRNAVSRAERDRLDIEALTRSMVEPGSSADAPGPGSPSAGAAREERGRRAAAHSDFDPDLPAPVKDSATRA